jgi:hypothetical protein
MFSKDTHWLIDGLLHREHQDREAAANRTQQAANGAEGSKDEVISGSVSNGAGSPAASLIKVQDKVSVLLSQHQTAQPALPMPSLHPHTRYHLRGVIVQP